MAFIDEQTLNTQIKEKVLCGAYFFCGNQPYSVLKYAEKFIESSISELNDFNLIRFDGDKLDILKFDEAVNSVPFFSDKKCVVINEPDGSKMDKETQNLLIKILKNIPETTIVVMYVTGYDIVSTDKRNTHNKFTSALSKAGVNICEFLKKSSSQTATYIQNEFSKDGYQISFADAEYLAEVTLSNDGIIENEINKLECYADTKKITRTMLDKIVPKSLSVSIFDITAAIIQGNIKKSMIILDELFNEKIEVSNIFAVLSNGFLDFYRAKIAMSYSVNINKSADDFSYFGRKFALEKASRVVGRKSLNYFHKSLKILEKANNDLFTIKLEEREYLETVIVKLSLLGG